MATPAINTPVSIPTAALPTKAILATTTVATPPTSALSAASSRLSKRLSNPTIFDGDRKDFRRF
jgi:hypothetical protein